MNDAHKDVKKAQQLMNYYAVEVLTYGATCARLRNLEDAWVNLQTQSEIAEIKNANDTSRADLPATDAQAMANPKVKALVNIMPEVLASLDASGWNVSLARDVRAALAALEDKP